MALKYQIIPVTPFVQNCTLLWCDETMQGTLVDAGGDMNKLITAVEQAGVKIVKLLLTHGHLDHVGAATKLAQHFAVDIEGPHQEEKFWLDMLPQQAMMFQFPPAQPFLPQRWLTQNDTVQVGNLSLEVRFCPGHTPGHVVFIHHDSKLAIVGDVLFKDGIGRTDFPRGDYQTLIHSIQQQLFSLPDDYQFIAGHGAMSTIGREKQSNPFVGKFG
ncbi:MBL fold metallo-hydrolase [Agitococcus lubricus]|uniref:Glyoxylase-like metal-dependent hydrolase (Beta-lactamase superfamily II) n=1 Tax=Agitococcus lubricus TaxID=1077255 RepID=A0A2T5J2B5_9GAMM|nr:MBL fold metallo-hydrolase [Agitococcus lubricus]PTQ90660.1 glyoxylase-like metal-dependent hydrolase (beta-lactamase superfamily II) [Agitococcus lubricus]